MLSRQATVRRIQHHQTSFTTNAKGTSLGRKHKRRKRPTESESHSVVSDSLRPHGLYTPWNSPGQNIGVGQPFPPPGDLPNPETEPRSTALRADSLPAELPGKPRPTEQKINPKQLKKWLVGSIIDNYLKCKWIKSTTKRHRLTGQMKTCACMHFHLPHHSA